MARLNARELAAMNNAARRFLQRRLELPSFVSMLERAGVSLHGARILDAGCGSGYSTELLAARFAPRRIVGFDLMPEQIERAHARGLARVELRQGDITAIQEADSTFDAVFVFGVLHHVPAWRRALAEIGRVLDRGGVLLVEELHGRFVDFEDRMLGMQHPHEARFDWPAFRRGLEEADFDILIERNLALNAARAFLCRKVHSTQNRAVV